VNGAAPDPDPRRPAAFRPPLGAVAPYDAIVFGLDGVVAGGVRRRVFPDASDLLQRLKSGRARVGLVTADRDAEAVLGSATTLFDVIVQRTGTINARPTATAIDGGPSSLETEAAVEAALLETANRLKVAPARTAVVAGDVATVQAARRSGFGLVVAIVRDDESRGGLEAAGADAVLDDVGQLDLGVSRADPWLLVYEGFDPVHEGHREALTALGDGHSGHPRRGPRMRR
jgi:phosphoglycolate phosphatase-like HAD superfamily hydrolase